MQKLDMVQIGALIDVAHNIMSEKVPAFYRQHGKGAQVEENVIHMLYAALDCYERVVALAVAHEPSCLAFAERASRLRAVIADHEFEMRAWLQVEAERSTKH